MPKKDKTTVGQQHRHLQMWHNLEEEGNIENYIRVTQAIPQSSQAGLNHVYDALKKDSSFLVLLFLFLRSMLNLYTFWEDGMNILDGRLELMGGGHLSKHGKLDCSPNHTSATSGFAALLYSHPTSWQNVSSALLQRPAVTCHMIPMNRFGAVEVGVIFEIVFGSLLILSTWLLIFVYMCALPPKDSLKEKIKLQKVKVEEEKGTDNNEKNKGELERLKAKMPTWYRKTEEMPSRFFAFFILGPNACAGFSSLVFLSGMSPLMFKSLFSRGEALLWTKMWCLSIFSPRAEALANKGKQMEQACCEKMHNKMFDKMRRSNDNKGITLFFVMCVVIYVLLVVFSLQQILIKLTVVDFAQKSDFYSWTLFEWLGFLGFVNQIVGCFSFYPATMAHLFVFAFGGHDAKLNSEECHAASWYLRLIAMKCQSGKFLQRKGRTAVVTVLAGLKAESFQQLLQSEQAATKAKHAQDERTKTYMKLNGDFGAEFMQALAHAKPDNKDLEKLQLKKGIGDRIAALEAERERLIDQARSSNFPDSAKETSGSAYLNLAAEVQNFIEDLKGMQKDGDDAFSNSQESDEEESEEESEGEKTGSDEEGDESEREPLSPRSHSR